MTNQDWSAEHNRLNSRIRALAAVPSLSISDNAGMAMLAHARFSASEGDYSAAPFLMLNLCTGHIGKMRRVGEGPSLEGVLRPGTFSMALPNTAASGYWPQTEMLGIAIHLSNFNRLTDNTYTADDFVPIANQLQNDTYLSAMMTALWRDAELHGLSSAFFEQGLSVILKHLSHIDSKPVKRRSAYPLTGERLQKVLDLIESRVGDDVSVSELAALAEQDSRSFTQSFTDATGYTPYAYFTVRRVEYAKHLLGQVSLNITDIAFTVGYSNPSKFAAAFRRVTSMTPNAWRKCHLA